MGFFGRQGNSPGSGDSLMLKIIGGFLGLFFVVIGTLGYLKYRKGSLDLELTTTSYREGDTLRGTLNVKARKPLHADKITASIWYEERWVRF